MKKVLMVAYDFPPMNTSGSARPQYFAKYLSSFGYWPIVLTREGVGSASCDTESLNMLEECCDIVRVHPWDNDDWKGMWRKWLRFISPVGVLLGKDKYWLADSVSWRLGLRWHEFFRWGLPGLVRGLRIMWTQKPDIVWATGPLWTNLRIGYWISKITRKPLIVDLRDPWTYGELWNPEKKIFCKREKKWEKIIFNFADRIVFTSPITAEIYNKKYAGCLENKIVTITNGFADVEFEPLRDIEDKKCLFVYLGKLDKGFRNPSVLFEAIRQLKKNSNMSKYVEFEFYTDAEWLEDEIRKYDIEDMARYRGYVSQGESLKRMSGADFLVLIQTVTGEGSDFVSGKIFEYLSARKPIFGIVPESGGNAWLMDTLNCSYVAFGASPHSIAQHIEKCIEDWKSGKGIHLDSEKLEPFSRKNLAAKLAAVLNDCADKKSIK